MVYVSYEGEIIMHMEDFEANGIDPVTCPSCGSILEDSSHFEVIKKE